MCDVSWPELFALNSAALPLPIRNDHHSETRDIYARNIILRRLWMQLKSFCLCYVIAL